MNNILDNWLGYVVPEACSPAAHLFWERGGLFVAFVSIVIGLTGANAGVQMFWASVGRELGRPLKKRAALTVGLCVFALLATSFRVAFGAISTVYENNAKGAFSISGAVLCAELCFGVLLAFAFFFCVDWIRASNASEWARMPRATDQLPTGQSRIKTDPSPEKENRIGRISLVIAGVGVAIEMVDWAFDVHECAISSFSPEIVAIIIAIISLSILAGAVWRKLKK